MSKRKAAGGDGSDSDDAAKAKGQPAVSRSGRMRKKSSRLIELEEESINEEALHYELTHGRTSSSSSKKSKSSSTSTPKTPAKVASHQGKASSAKTPAAKSTASKAAAPATKQLDTAVPLAVSTPTNIGITETPQAKRKVDGASKAEISALSPAVAGTKVPGSAPVLSKKQEARQAADSGASLATGGRAKRQTTGALKPTESLLSTPKTSLASRSKVLEFLGNDEEDDDEDDEDAVDQLIEDGDLDVDDDFARSEDDEDDDVNDDDEDDVEEDEVEDGSGSKDGASSAYRAAGAPASGAAASKFFEKQKPRGTGIVKKRRNRAPTAYTLWCSSYRQKIIAQNPEIDFASMSTRLGEIWHALPQKEKVQWRKKAKKLAVQGLSGTILDQPARPKPSVNLLPTGSKSSTATAQRSSASSGSKVTATAPSANSRKTTVGDAKDGQCNATGPSKLPTPTRLTLDTLAAEQSKPEPYKVVTSEPLDVAAHLKLLGESLSLIGIRLTNQANIAVQGSLPVLLDSMLCAAGALMCLTQQVPEMDGMEPEVHLKTLDNIAYFMPGI